jgi:hypothetical protein
MWRRSTVVKRTKGTVERFSPEWIRMIPLKLARGIWGEIEDALEGEEHAETKATRRRKRQIERGIIKPNASTDDHRSELQAADTRKSEREDARAELRKQRAAAAAQRRLDSDVSDGVSRHREPTGTDLATPGATDVPVDRGDGPIVGGAKP